MGPFQKFLWDGFCALGFVVGLVSLVAYFIYAASRHSSNDPLTINSESDSYVPLSSSDQGALQIEYEKKEREYLEEQRRREEDGDKRPWWMLW